MDPVITEHVRILKCCTTFVPFRRLPKEIQNKGVHQIVELLQNKAFCNVRNILDLDKFHNLAFMLKINLDVSSSIGSDIFIKGFTNYLLFNYLLKKEVINKQVLQSIEKCIITPENLLGKELQKFNEKMNKKYIDNVRQRTEEKIEHKTTRMYFCKKCQNRKTRAYELQLRCGDEGGTLFIECVVCGHKWKKGS